MRFMLMCLAFALSMTRWSPVAFAAPTACDSLAGEQRRLALEILESQHAYDCCDGTLSQCLRQKPLCRLVRRLSDDICRRVAAGQSRPDIERELTRRASSMMPTGTVYRIDTRNSPIAGSPDAKVTVVAYLCPRCPYCARLEPELYRSVTSGKLAGKVKLYVRMFPVRNHAGSTDAGLGLIAAAKLGKFWEFLQHLYREFDHFNPARLDDVAAAEGMDRKKFSEAAQDPAARQQLVESKKEGVKNGVEVTPTLFINGRKYTGDMKLNALEDVLEEEHDRVTDKRHD